MTILPASAPPDDLLPSSHPLGPEGLDAQDAQFLREVAAESIGWLPLGQGAYLHVATGAPNTTTPPAPDDDEEQPLVITVVGAAEAALAGMNVLWLSG